MRIVVPSLIALSLCLCGKERDCFYSGSTPVHPVIRSFLGISLTDSIDFIRWKLVLRRNQFELSCAYGIGKAGTPGFIEEKRVAFSGKLLKNKNQCRFENAGKTLSMAMINSNLLQLLDDKNNMLAGNGGYSYTLNNNVQVKTDQCNFIVNGESNANPMVFEGRTPCQELSRMIGLDKRPACDKMKWYIIFISDSTTGNPSYYLKGGRNYRPETMERGEWKVIHGKNGRIVYRLSPGNQVNSFYLLKAAENILFFTDREGNLLVGNEDFSYTLNRAQ